MRESQQLLDESRTETLQMQFTPDNIRAALQKSNSQKKTEKQAKSNPRKIKGLAQLTNQKNNATAGVQSQTSRNRQ